MHAMYRTTIGIFIFSSTSSALSMRASKKNTAGGKSVSQ